MVCGGAEWRGEKGLDDKNNGENERNCTILLTSWNGSGVGVCEFEGNHVNNE